MFHKLKRIDFITLDPVANLLRDALHAELPQLESRPIVGRLEDLKNYSVDAIVTPGNSFGHMTGGYDLAVLAVTNPQLMDRVIDRIQRHWLGEQPVGTADVYQVHSHLTTHVVYTPTMRVPKTLPRDSDVPYVSTMAAIQAVDQWNRSDCGPYITSLLLTPMGGGVGRIHAKDYIRQMILAIKRCVEPSSVVDLFGETKHLDTYIHTGRHPSR